MRARFSADEWPAALDASPGAWRSPDVRWRPDPWVLMQPRLGLAVHWRRGPETVWLGSRRFEAAGRGAPAAGGCRVWPLAGGGHAAGLLLLGQPWRIFARLDEAGHPFYFDPLRFDPPGTSPTAPNAPMPDPWRTVVFAWATLAAAPALASTVAALEAEVTLAWAPLAAEVVALDPVPGGVTLRVQSGIAAQFRKLAAEGRPPGELALMAVSDAAGGADLALRRVAQERLAALALPEPDELVRRGVAAQERARARLQGELPALVAALVRGDGWGI